MLTLCGIVKVKDYERKSFSINVKKWDVTVDLTEKMNQYLESLNKESRSLVEKDIKEYLDHGPIDYREITIDSGESQFMTVNKILREVLCKYLDADRRVLRIKFKFYNRLERCTYVDDEVSGDYLLIPVMCKTAEQEAVATGWCKELLKGMVQSMYEKYGTKLTEEQALSMLKIDQEE